MAHTARLSIDVPSKCSTQFFFMTQKEVTAGVSGENTDHTINSSESSAVALQLS